jgi:16S rRNA (cytosine967-C5)-methyltransferase
VALMEFQKSQANPDEILESMVHEGIPLRERALAWDIAKGTIKYIRKLDQIAKAYMNAPVSKQKPAVAAALRIGLYQLTEMSGIPQFAAVDETVSILSETKMKRDAGFVNAILRAYLREPQKVKFPDREKETVQYLAVCYSFPDWLVSRWLARFGLDETENLLAAFNQRPPGFFRALRKFAADDIIKALKSENIEAERGRFFPEYLLTFQVHGVIESVPFETGQLIAQDESQGLPINLLDPAGGAEVLDLCSAPGGKTIALADLVGQMGRVDSVDKDRRRLELVRQNAGRIGLGNIEYRCTDVLKFAPGRKFKYILLDVPCSGLGTMWSNADLRWTKKERDIAALARTQGDLLRKSAEFLGDGGRLVYSTCTTEPDEIEGVVNGFLNENKQFRLMRSTNNIARRFETVDGFYRTWPHRHGIGGGGFALLEKLNENDI